MARIVENAAETFNGDWEDMMRALGMVFLGLPADEGPYSGQGTLFHADTQSDKPVYFLGGFFKDAGFNINYKDVENQIYHVWGFIANTAALNGNFLAIRNARSEAIYANNWHEFSDSWNGKEGASRQDFLLSRAGIEIGSQIANGAITPDQLGDALRMNLGDKAVVDTGFVLQYWMLPDAQP